MSIINILLAALFIIIQFYFFLETIYKQLIFSNLFPSGEDGYQVEEATDNGKTYMHIRCNAFKQKKNRFLSAINRMGRFGRNAFKLKSDLDKLVSEINEYVRKTKGTTDFSIIQNKTERLVDMRYDDATARISFPVYIGLMGTFFGVFVGIISFRYNVMHDSVNDQAITGLLGGVLISMSTSFVGLLLTTINHFRSSNAKRKVDIDKNKFFDFIQTELMPSLDVSMVAALNKLHRTVAMFEPSFNRVINKFQNTFESCTKAFGNQFADNVKVITKAVATMGENMDQINQNISLQKKLLDTLKTKSYIKGLEAFVEATERFTQLTASLDKFEEARQMMLSATQEVINMQKQYAESLEIPKEIVLKVNAILNRLTKFEDSINVLGKDIAQTQLLGNSTINLIDAQLNGIKKKGRIADKYLQIADGKLKDLYTQQTASIQRMTKNYEEAIKQHIQGFKTIIEESTNDFHKRHEEFLKALDEKFNITEVHEDFSNLKRLNDINNQLSTLKRLEEAFSKYQTSLNEIKRILEGNKNTKDTSNEKGHGSTFGFPWRKK